MSRFGMDDGSEAWRSEWLRDDLLAQDSPLSSVGGESVSGQRVTGCCVASHISYPRQLQRRRLGSVARFGEPLFELVRGNLWVTASHTQPLPACPPASACLARLPATAQIR